MSPRVTVSAPSRTITIEVTAEEANAAANWLHNNRDTGTGLIALECPVLCNLYGALRAVQANRPYGGN